MASEVEQLRQALAEERQGRAEERRRREEAEEHIQRLALTPYLDACHTLSLAIDIVADPTKTTQGVVVQPVGRRYPQRIVPWDGFLASQNEIWNLISEPSFTERQSFPSRHQLDGIMAMVKPISSEPGLRFFETMTVEYPVENLMTAAFDNEVLRQQLGLRGAVRFQDHTNLGTPYDNCSEPREDKAGDTKLAPATPEPRPRPVPGGRRCQADQFCIYKDGPQDIPVIAVEYKPPHKLSEEHVVTGLEFEIWPERDAIGKDRESFASASRWLAAAVVTQLFSSMIGKGIRYGYVSTGQTFIFVRISLDDPAEAYYSVCVPNKDVLDNDENRYYRTAIAQVFAFILQAIRAPSPSQVWHDKAVELKKWEMEWDNVLDMIPETARKGKERATPYKSQLWPGGSISSPIRKPILTRSRCRETGIQPDGRDSSSDEGGPSPSPTPGRSTRSGGKLASTGSGRNAATSSTGSGKGRGGGGERRQGIKDRAYCTHQCLFGLARGGPMDPTCPNAPYHGSSHISRADFLHLLRAQLADDRGPDADAWPCYVAGAVGALFKVRLSAHGYTLVAKGVQSGNLGRLQHEQKIYNRLSTVQGRHVPVCLGLIDLKLPYYWEGGIFKHFLLLSWAGWPLFKCMDQVDKAVAVDATVKAYTELHRLGVFHNDAEVRNIMYNQNLMIIDFERAKLRSGEPLGPTSPNSRKRKWEIPQNQGKDAFAEELRSVERSVRSCFENAAK